MQLGAHLLVEGPVAGAQPAALDEHLASVGTDLAERHLDVGIGASAVIHRSADPEPITTVSAANGSETKSRGRLRWFA